MQEAEPRITAGPSSPSSASTQSVKSRVSYGGTAPANVRRQAKSLVAKKLAKEQAK